MASTQEIVSAAVIAFNTNSKIHTFLNDHLLSSLAKNKFRVEHKEFSARASVYLEKAPELTQYTSALNVDARDEHKRVLRKEIRYNHYLKQMVSRCQRRLWNMRSMGLPEPRLPSDYIYQDFPNILWHTVEETKPLSALCDLISDQYSLVNNKMVMDVIQSIQPEDILAECKANMADKSLVDRVFTQDHIESNSHNVGVEKQIIITTNGAGIATDQIVNETELSMSRSAPKTGVIFMESINARQSMARASDLNIESNTVHGIANPKSMSYGDIVVPTLSKDFLTYLYPKLPSESWDIINESVISASNETKRLSPNIPAIIPVPSTSTFSSSVGTPDSAPISAEVSALSTSPSVDVPSLTTPALVTLTGPQSIVKKATVSSVKPGPHEFPLVGSDRPHVYENRVVRKEHTLKEGASSAETDMMRVKREKVQQEMAETRQRLGQWFRHNSSNDNKPSTSKSSGSTNCRNTASFSKPVSRKRKFENEQTAPFMSAKSDTMETSQFLVSVENPILVLKISRADSTWTSSQVLKTKRQRRS